ncbi:MAG: HAMP domain-containing histidine kinase [Acidobacteria bacterium]|nr:HAMP domain-containing histidine kinase [Acidobacteriota bacterium]
MTFRDWFRPPRHVLTIFLSVAVVSAGALGWLSWLLVAQDRALDVQRRQARLEQAADRATAIMQGALADLELQLTASSAHTSEPPPGVVIVIGGPTGVIDVVHPDGGLLYYPEPGQAPEAPTAPFIEAEQAEFARRDLVAAGNLYTALASGTDTAVRAGALAGLARIRRKGQYPDAALAAYDELAELSGVRVAGLPPGLVARTGRARVLEDTGRASELRDEAARLDEELRSGRWQLTKSQHQFYSAEARRWLGQPELEMDTADREAEALADAVQWLWDERPWEEGPSPEPAARRLVQMGGMPVLAVWNASPESLRVGVAGPSYLTALGHEAIPDTDLEWTLSDPAGRVVLGEPSTSPLAVRTAAASRLPWSLQVYSAAGPDLSPTSPRQGLLLWVLAVLAVVWVTGAYFIVRAISRELAVERLQSDFVAGVSHEFRSPLASLSQIAEMLVSNRFASDDLRRQSYDVLARETDRLRRLVEGLLDFGRFAAGGAVYHFEPVDIGAFLETVISEFRARAAATGHTIELSLPAVTTYVRGDRDALSRAIWNLLDNAVKYSPDCHTVWLDVEQDRDRVSLTVRDQGLGIPVDEQRAIFERFVRGAESKARRIKGTGVGLAMVRRIAEAHGGEVRLTSQPGQGSRFTMILRTYDRLEAAGGVA